MSLSGHRPRSGRREGDDKSGGDAGEQLRRPFSWTRGRGHRESARPKGGHGGRGEGFDLMGLGPAPVSRAAFALESHMIAAGLGAVTHVPRRLGGARARDSGRLFAGGGTPGAKVPAGDGGFRKVDVGRRSRLKRRDAAGLQQIKGVRGCGPSAPEGPRPNARHRPNALIHPPPPLPLPDPQGRVPMRRLTAVLTLILAAAARAETR